MTQQRQPLEGSNYWDVNADAYKAFILFIDILSSFINVTIKAFNPTRGRAITSLVFFSFFWAVGLTGLIAVSVFLLCHLIDGNYGYYIVSDSVIIFGAILYYTGDNLPAILTTYSEEISCDDKCVQDAQTAGRCLLLAALICFRLIPPLIRKLLQAQEKNVKEIGSSDTEKLSASFILHMLALLLEFDTIYSVVWDITRVSGNCSPTDLGGSWASWVIFFLVWIAFVLLYYFFEACNFSGTLDIWSVILTCIVLPVLCLLFGTYLLGDNDEPIGCICNGDFNTTTSATGCTEMMGNQVRSGFMGTTLGLLITSLVMAAIFLCKA